MPARDGRRRFTTVRGYDSTSYGDGFADVYDEWYAEVTDVQATVELVRRLAASDDRRGRVLELGVGTGRLAVPMAAAGLDVTGVDSSSAMLEVLGERARTEPAADRVVTIRGDMVDDLPDGPFDVVLVAYNTLFNLLDERAQRSCFRAVAARLADDGRFVVEAIVPDPAAPAGSTVSVRSMTADRVVLTVSDHRPAEQRTEGQFVELTESGGVRLRPWAIRWCGVGELDDMAADAGLVLEERHADMAGSAFHADADAHVSVYRPAS